jgi:hypothetical protein
MTSASASTEQATNGQMGQPAACMIENNLHLQADNLSWIMAYCTPWNSHFHTFQAPIFSVFFVRHNPQKLWITLWVSSSMRAGKPRQIVNVTK